MFSINFLVKSLVQILRKFERFTLLLHLKFIRMLINYIYIYTIFLANIDSFNLYVTQKHSINPVHFFSIFTINFSSS